MPSSKKDINQQLRDTIYKKVTKKTHSNQSPKKNGDGTIAKCIELFNKGADPNVLIQLEKSLREQEKYQKYHNYYTEKFLPALETKVTESEELMKPSVLNNEEKSSQRSPTIKAKILGIILEITGITNKSSDKNYSSSTIQNQKGSRNNQTDRQGNVMKPFNKQSFSGEVPNSTSSDMTPQEEDSVDKGVGGTGISGTYNPLRSSGYYGALITPTSEQSQARKEIPQSQLNGFSSQSDLSIDCKDLKNDSDSGINSSGLVSSSRRSSLTSVASNSSEESVSSTEESNGLQPKDEGETKLAHLTKTRPKGPSGRRSPSKYHEKIEDQVKKESPQCVISVTGSQAMQSEKKEAANYENKSKVKQPNNRNLHVALVAGCALSTIGCIVAGAMTSGLVGAGLLAMAAVFAIAAVAELHSNFLSSKLTSINVEPLIDDKKLTACSHL
ncbi:MAG: DUF350 domain-containing protein [Wolbachia endosymbiont of Nomada marshamella]|nr:DUF350 domain-containing protein [Wolbachia endosymbiont of Nomada marshamella]